MVIWEPLLGHREILPTHVYVCMYASVCVSECMCVLVCVISRSLTEDKDTEFLFTYRFVPMQSKTLAQKPSRILVPRDVTPSSNFWAPGT